MNETKELGAATLVKMSEQREQIIQIDKGVDEVFLPPLSLSFPSFSLFPSFPLFLPLICPFQVESNLRIANRHLRTFVRRLATDKIIMGFVLLIFAAIVFIIVSNFY